MRGSGAQTDHTRLSVTISLVVAVSCLDAAGAGLGGACASQAGGCHLALGVSLVHQQQPGTGLFPLSLLAGWALIECCVRRIRAAARVLSLPGGLLLTAAISSLLDLALTSDRTRWLDPPGLAAINLADVALAMAGLSAIYAVGAILGGGTR
jgi:hypothetical protein